jgi:hypothetical protein
VFYRDKKDVVIQGTWNRETDWTAKRHIVAFAESMDDAQQWLRDTPRNWSVEASHGHPATKDWDLEAGYEGTLTLARDGWHEGVEMIHTALQAIVPASGREARWGYSQTGGSVSVSRYLTGHPKCMRNRRKKNMGGVPVLHLVVNVVASCAVKAERMANYGAAITGLIDRLENSGRRVHLDMVMAVNSKGIRLSMGWNVKRASEPLDLSQVAFAIAHPAAFRRLGFAMMERTHKDAESAAYGYSADALPWDVPDYTDGTMIVDGLNHQPSRCATPKDALRLAIEQVNKAAVEAGHASLEQPLIDEDDWLAELAD